jgi:signal transduction histidine kinase
MPRLSFFITEHSHEILDAWEAFARELPATKRMDVATLRDHAQRMLDAIVAALEAPQREEQRDRKLREREDAHGETLTAASEHGRCRAEHGYSNDSTLAEFRALRASVIRLWLKHQHDVGRAELEEMRRFNEAIDEAIAESLAQYSADVNDARDRILATLGHDLRTPVNAMLISSRVLLAESEGGNASHELLDVIERSAHRMTHLINDLLDLALARGGDTMRLHRASTDLGALVREVGAEVATASPGAPITIETSGALIGEWDRTRLGEALTNLLGNAVAHGSPGKPITVTASGDGDVNVTVAITNEGGAIPRDRIMGLFNPPTADAAERKHLGLGLYIVNKIVEAHGGSIYVRSSNEHGTTFRITIPRHGTPAQGASPETREAYP